MHEQHGRHLYLSELLYSYILKHKENEHEEKSCYNI